MAMIKKVCEANKTDRLFTRAGYIISQFLLAAVGTIFSLQIVNAQVDCSIVSCNSTDQQTIGTYHMFDETNFDPVLDVLGTPRRFWVHIPQSYDTLAMNELMPTIFAFHGGVSDPEPRAMMLDGKWADYFNQDIAFVIPRGEANPCDTSLNPKKIWLGPNWGPGIPSGTPLPLSCDPATQRVDSLGNPVTYFNASLTSTFKDVIFIENLRSMLLSRFPKLNPNKVYITGFSSGGGMNYSLLCYRANLFRGSSIVARTLYGEQQRGDYNDDGLVVTDPNSLVATCGKTELQIGFATGIPSPHLWGEFPVGFGLPSVRVSKPIALFVGDHDDNYTMQDINDTGENIRARNNLNNVFFILNPFMNVRNDDAQTQRRRFVFVNNASQTFSVFSRYFVQRIDDGMMPSRESASHAMPDAQECPPLFGSPNQKMTCDYSYTDETINFFQTHADLNLNP
jgi:poly(3-hydroxybutyrate) depolymerase